MQHATCPGVLHDHAHRLTELTSMHSQANLRSHSIARAALTTNFAEETTCGPAHVSLNGDRRDHARCRHDLTTSLMRLAPARRRSCIVIERTWRGVEGSGSALEAKPPEARRLLDLLCKRSGRPIQVSDRRCSPDLHRRLRHSAHLTRYRAARGSHLTHGKHQACTVARAARSRAELTLHAARCDRAPRVSNQAHAEDHRHQL